MAELERWLEERIAEAERVRGNAKHKVSRLAASFGGGKAAAYRDVLEYVRSRRPKGLTG